MYNLSVDEISMVDGGGDGGWQAVAQDVTCTVFGAGVTGIVGTATKNPALAAVTGAAAAIACSAAGRSVGMSTVKGNAGLAGGRGL